jgi:hypothetical protein
MFVLFVYVRILCTETRRRVNTNNTNYTDKYRQNTDKIQTIYRHIQTKYEHIQPDAPTGFRTKKIWDNRMLFVYVRILFV